MIIYSVSIPNDYYYAAEPAIRDVLSKINDKMDRTSPIDRAYIAELLGGKRDTNRVFEIINGLAYNNGEDRFNDMLKETTDRRYESLISGIYSILSGAIDWDVDDDNEWDDDDDEYDDLDHSNINWEGIDWDCLRSGGCFGNNYKDGQITLDDVMPDIERVIFNNPATIVYWDDGTKTVVKCQEGDTYSQETGLAMAIAKKVFGNNSSYNEVFKQWVEQGSK